MMVGRTVAPPDCRAHSAWPGKYARGYVTIAGGSDLGAARALRVKCVCVLSMCVSRLTAKALHSLLSCNCNNTCTSLPVFLRQAARLRPTAYCSALAVQLLDINKGPITTQPSSLARSRTLTPDAHAAQSRGLLCYHPVAPGKSSASYSTASSSSSPSLTSAMGEAWWSTSLHSSPRSSSFS